MTWSLIKFKDIPKQLFFVEFLISDDEESPSNWTEREKKINLPSEGLKSLLQSKEFTDFGISEERWKKEGTRRKANWEDFLPEDGAKIL